MKNVLADHGIAAVLDGEATASTFGNFGPAMDARLLVPTTDLARAKSLISDIEAELLRGSGAPWFCGPCQEEVAGTFDYCWSCNKAREEVEDTSVDLTTKSDEHFESRGSSPSVNNFDECNPYAAGQHANEVSSRTFSEDDKEQVTRAFRAAIVGLFFLPIMMSLYSAMLLATVPASKEWPAETTRKYYQTWVVNVLALLLWGTFAYVAG